MVFSSRPVPEFGSTCGDWATFIIAASPVKRAHQNEHGEGDQLRPDAGEPRRLGVGADGVDEAAGGQVLHRQRQQHQQQQRHER